MTLKKILIQGLVWSQLCFIFSALMGVERSRAHEIPVSARVNVLIHPASQGLSVLLRMPLGALGDVDYPTRPGNFVVISRADNALRNVVQLSIIPALKIYEDGRLLDAPKLTSVRISLPSDRSFETYGEAIEHFSQPKLADELDLYWSQQLIDLRLDYEIQSSDSRFSIELLADRFGQSFETILRFMPDQKPIRAYEWHGNAGLVQLDPGWSDAFLNFLQGGFKHILFGSDHLLFLLALLLPLQGLRVILVIVTSFTCAHALALIATFFDAIPSALWFAPLIEALIAATILYTAVENILTSHYERRWIGSFWFGIIHGFGFSFGLKESLQFAGDHLLASLFAFNLGIELAQIIFILCAMFVIRQIYARLASQGMALILFSALIGHTALHWLMERGEIVMKYPLPVFDLLFLIGMMRTISAGLILVLFLWLVFHPINRFLSQTSSSLKESSRGADHM